MNIFQKSSKNILGQKLLKEDRLINLFHPKSCCVFVSLLRPIGKVMRVTTTFSSVFGYEEKEILG
jgi:hypothetical protein